MIMFAVYAARIDAEDPLSGLETGERPDPEPPAGWTTVTVKATALNHHDVWSLRGVGLPADRLPMILGCDGRSHLAETLPLLPAGKPLFIDKPLTASLTDAAHLLALAKQTRCPVFSASALRYRSVSAQAAPLAHSRPSFIEVTVPKAAVPGHPDCSWHGIHGIETVFAVLGRGCETVERVRLDDYDAVRATWSNGARAVIKRSAESTAQGFPSVFIDDAGNREAGVAFRYEPLLAAVVDFFLLRQSPVPARKPITTNPMMTTSLVEVSTFCTFAVRPSPKMLSTVKPAISADATIWPAPKCRENGPEPTTIALACFNDGKK